MSPLHCNDVSVCVSVCENPWEWKGVNYRNDEWRCVVSLFNVCASDRGRWLLYYGEKIKWCDHNKKNHYMYRTRLKWPCSEIFIRQYQFYTGVKYVIMRLTESILTTHTHHTHSSYWTSEYWRSSKIYDAFAFLQCHIIMYLQETLTIIMYTSNGR